MCKESAAADWQQQLQELIDKHFLTAHERVDVVYAQHFSSLGGVFKRHWQGRADIPRDLANIPRAAWRFTRRAMGRGRRSNEKKEEATLSRKEQAVVNIILHELLQLAELESSVLTHVRQHPKVDAALWEELQTVVAQYTPEKAQYRLQQALSRLTITQEGGRDVFIFLTLGLVGKSLSEKVAFGSAVSAGSVAATSLYISQQSFWGGLWANWFGAPGWVAASGAVGGIVTMLVATPVIAPVIECGINKFKAKRFLHAVIDRVEQDMAHSRPDVASVMGYLGSYIQLLPDLLHALKAIR